MSKLTNVKGENNGSHFETKGNHKPSLSNICITGGAGCGKTVTAMNMVTELAKIKENETGKKLRIVCMDNKCNWRNLSKTITHSKFKLYTLGYTGEHELNFNPFKIPNGVNHHTWLDGIIEIFCRNYGLFERGRYMLSEIVNALYKEEGVIVTFAKVYEKMYEMYQSSENETQKDSYAKLLDRLQAFGRKDSIESKLFANEDGMGVDDLIAADDITVFESSGLESTFSQFIFGVITFGYYKIAESIKCGGLDASQHETLLVIEEAEKILLSSKYVDTYRLCAQNEKTSVFDEFIEKAADCGLYTICTTQRISHMPAAIGNIFSTWEILGVQKGIIRRLSHLTNLSK